MKYWLASCLIILIIYLFGAGAVVSAGELSHSATVVARFHDGEITTVDIQSVIDTLPEYKKFVPKDQTETEWKTEIINDLVARYYLAQEAKNLGLDTTDKYRNLIAQKTIELSWKTFYQDEIESTISVNTAAIKAYYQDHPELFHTPALAVGRHIFLNLTKVTTPEAKKQVLERAEQVQQKALSGENFQELVITHSDSPTAAQGGQIGPIAENNAHIQLAIRSTLFAMEIGQVSGLITTPYGYEILKVERKIPAWDITLNEAQKEIQQILLNQKRKDRVGQFADALFKKYSVKLYPDRFESDSTAILIEVIASPAQFISDTVQVLPNRITVRDLSQQFDLSKIQKDNRESFLRGITINRLALSEMQLRNYPNHPKLAHTIKEIQNTVLAQLAIEHRIETMDSFKPRSPLQVTPKEIQAFYQFNSPNQERYSLLHNQVKIQAIVVLAKSNEPFRNFMTWNYAMEEARQRAQQAQAFLIAGQDFKTVAKEFSDDTSGNPGAESDYFDSDSYPQFSLDKLRIGEISQPIEAGNGYVIIKLVTRRNQPIQTLKERKDWIISFLKQEKIQKAREKILLEPVRSSGLQIYTSLLAADPFAEIRQKSFRE